MSIKSVLIPIADAEAVGSGLVLALTLAQRLEARLSVMFPSPDLGARLPLLADVTAAGVADRLIAAMEEDAARRAEQTRGAVEAVCAAHGARPVETFTGSGFAVRYLAAAGTEENLTARLGRVHDLVVVPHPRSDDPALTPLLGAALLETGRPVLIAPARAPERFATRAVVAWNGSIEAARALSAAAELIETKARISIVTVGESGPPAPSPEDAVTYLAAHGYAAEVKRLSAGGPAIAEALLGEVDRQDADLLVLGAYSHSRLRETILGGVTRDILANLEVPVLMAH